MSQALCPADPFTLYEAAVQSPEVEIALFERVFAARFGRDPVSLREDFCGTALLCRKWAESDDDREAHGVDLDEEVLDWATARRGEMDEDEAARVTLIRGDVRAPSERTFDIITAGNFSWALFEDEALAAYLANCQACLEDEGLLALEIFGGADLRRPLRHEHPKDGFTYIWEQHSFDDSNQRLEASIHFRRGDGTELRDAFRYAFHLREYEALEAMLHTAGFDEIALWVERDTGGFEAVDREPSAAAWSGYVFASRR